MAMLWRNLAQRAVKLRLGLPWPLRSGRNRCSMHFYTMAPTVAVSCHYVHSKKIVTGNRLHNYFAFMKPALPAWEKKQHLVRQELSLKSWDSQIQTFTLDRDVWLRIQ